MHRNPCANHETMGTVLCQRQSIVLLMIQCFTKSVSDENSSRRSKCALMALCCSWRRTAHHGNYLLISYRIILEIYRLFGCSNDGKVVGMKTKIFEENQPRQMTENGGMCEKKTKTREQLKIDKIIIW